MVTNLERGRERMKGKSNCLIVIAFGWVGNDLAVCAVDRIGLL